MTLELFVSTEAEADLAQAAAWYNRIRPGLGNDFILCVEQSLDRILEYPEAFPIVVPKVRRARIRRFPYGVFFRIRQQRIEVEALFHLRQNPSRVRQRVAPQ